MTILLMVFSLVCAAVLQALLPPWAWLGQAGVPFLLSVVLYYALERGYGVMLAAAIAGGLLQDALGMIPLGYSSFCFCVAALVVERYRESVFVGQWLTHVVFGALASAGVTLGLALLLGAGGLAAPNPGRVVLKTVGALLLGALVVPLVFHVIDSLDRLLGNVEARED